MGRGIHRRREASASQSCVCMCSISDLPCASSGLSCLTRVATIGSSTWPCTPSAMCAMLLSGTPPFTSPFPFWQSPLQRRDLGPLPVSAASAPSTLCVGVPCFGRPGVAVVQAAACAFWSRQTVGRCLPCARTDLPAR